MGIAFEAVGRLDLFSAYFQGQVVMLEEVRIEIFRRAAIGRENGLSDRDHQVNTACQGLRMRIHEGFFEVVALGGTFLDELEDLQEELSASAGHVRAHEGEAATIVWAMAARQRPVILTNDGDAQALADQRDVGWLNAPLLLAGMVDSELVTGAEALELTHQMNRVSGVAGPYPESPDWFRREAHRSR